MQRLAKNGDNLKGRRKGVEMYFRLLANVVVHYKLPQKVIHGDQLLKVLGTTLYTKNWLEGLSKADFRDLEISDEKFPWMAIY